MDISLGCRSLLIFGLMLLLLGCIMPTPAGALHGSPECDREHEGDLVISGTEVFTISDEVFCQYGTIIVKDKAKLVVADATLSIRGSSPDLWGPRLNLSVQDSGTLEMRNVVLDTPEATQIYINTYGSPQVLLGNITYSAEPDLAVVAANSATVQISSSVLRRLLIGDAAVAIVDGSSIIERISLIFSDPLPVELEDLTPGYFASWEFRQNQHPPFRLLLTKTEVGGWAIHVRGEGQVIIKDSTLERLDLALYGASGELSGLRPGLFQSWDLQREIELANATNVTLDNTSVSIWLLSFEGYAYVTISDSDIPNIEANNAYVEIEFFNTRLGAIRSWGNATGMLTFDNVQLWHGFYLNRANLILQGNLTIEPDAFIAYWHASTMLREYKVEIRDDDGSPIAGARIALTGPDGQELFSSTTDAQGRTEFRLSFTDDNYQDEWTLKATLPDGKVITRSIGFLTDTPIEIRTGT